MKKALTILIIFVMAFETEGMENFTYTISEGTSTAVIMETEMSAILFSQRRHSRRRRRSRERSSKQDTNKQINDTANSTKVIEAPVVRKVVRVNLDTLTTDYVVQDGEVISGTLSSYQLTIADKATVMLSGVDITTIPNMTTHQFAGITCAGDATIILSDGTTNKVKGGYENYPGIYVPQGHTLTIKGHGTLESGNQGWAAGIGGGKDLACGNIVIEEGSIRAEGGMNAAAIGSGWLSSCGDITIKPTVTSVTLIRDKSGGNSIGAGKDASCGKVTVADGIKVTEESHIIYH